MRSKAPIAWVAGLLASIAALAVGLALGPAPWSAAQLARMAWGGDAAAQAILLHVRAPRTLGAWLVGAALSLAGLLLQTATHNPVADPYLIGTSAGATLSAVLAVPLLLQLGDALGLPLGNALAWLQPAAALAGAMAAAWLTFALARGHRNSAERVLVGGLVITAFGGAATSFALTRLSDVRLRAATQWLMGGVALPDLQAALPGALAIALALLWSMRGVTGLQALSLGDEAAHGLGLDASRVGRRAMGWAALLSAVAVSLAGIVGFVGLLVPHALRLWLGRDLRALLPGAVLLGGAALTILDALCRVVVAPGELPLGILTALLGCPVLVVLIRGSGQSTPVPVVRAARHPVQAQGYVAATALQVSARTRNLLTGVDLRWPAPGLVAVVGPNGSGKTTLLRALAGLAAVSGGQVGGDAGAHAVRAGLCTYLPQDPELSQQSTVRELVAIGRHRALAEDWGWRLQGRLPKHELQRIEEALARVDLLDRAQDPLSQLSGGERQRALVAMTLAADAKVLLLDEPTASLDWSQARRVLEDLHRQAQQLGLLVVVSLHDLPLAVEWADRIAVLDRGQLVADGGPQDPAVRAAVLRVLGATLPAEPGPAASRAPAT